MFQAHEGRHRIFCFSGGSIPERSGFLSTSPGSGFYVPLKRYPAQTGIMGEIH